MLAYCLEWHLRRKLAPLLLEDAEREAAADRAASKRTPVGLPVQSLRTLLEHLGTLTLNRVTLMRDDPHESELLARKTSLQAVAFALLGVGPDGLFPVD